MVSTLIVSVSGYFAYRYIPIFLADKTWIINLGYKENEVHKLTFNLVGDRSCPEIPVKVGNNEYRLGFDTGCETGILFTNVIEDKIDYTKLNSDKYVVLPLYKTTSKGQQDLPFFEAEYKNKPIIVYLDTGKNYSYLYNPDCKYSIGDKPTKLFDIPLKVGSMNLLVTFDLIEQKIIFHKL